MPPKPKSPAKGKKGKLSKAEKERLKKEEAERKLQEEEEARLKAEQEERERLERERLEREERERLEAAESQRHRAEVAELKSILEEIKALYNMHEQRRSKAKWDRYMQCSGSPDPTIAPEINTYINLWKEDTQKSGIDVVLEESKQTLALIAELEFLIEDMPEEKCDESMVERYRETIVELQNLLTIKLDEATCILLKDSSSMADSETGNLQLVKSNPVINMMLWGNLTKNPRFKSFEFEEQHFIFELPKQLALTDIAIRIIHTKYDHFSHLCRTFWPKKKKKPQTPPEEDVHGMEEKMDEGQGAAGESEEKEGGEKEGGEEEVEEKAEEPTEEKENAEDKGDENGEGAETSATQKEGEPGEGDGDAVVEEEDEEDEDELDDLDDEDTVDMRAYQVLGGVVHFDLLCLPPQPKQVKSWLMTQVTMDELKRVPYAADSNKLGLSLSGNMTMTMGQTLDPKAVANAAAAAEALGAPPVGVTLKLPDNVLFSEEPQMAYWSHDRKQWRLDGFVDVKFDEESRMLSFKTVNFGPLACIQDKHINMPFQSWELRPIGADHARFTIIAAIIEAEIEIKGPLCCFKQTADSDFRSELDAIRGKWMEPRELIKVLKNTGVNLFPEDDSKKYVSISEKDPDVENGLYQQMALTASHFAYSWSKWNTESGTERIILQGCEKLEDDIPLDPQPEGDEEEEWALLMVSRERAMKLKMTEYEEEFSDVHAEGSQFHADLYHMVNDLSTEPGLERMRNSHYRFVDAVYQMLAATRVIAYS
ncbi:LOW QUALITY PROTEIN: dynein axonemal intermediate chain 7 homolog [Amphiura filiformis]|uniref:LOW QUALITY PROTEIN: dynein axonemal intermediate chain 7 homolog n=1 Tax=Amphiura filiformis TaxID=82378 RepID=UPI003B2278B3